MPSQNINKYLHSSAVYPRNSVHCHCQEFDRLLAQFVVTGNVALDVVTNHQLRKFCGALNPRYKLPCRQYLIDSVLLPMRYNTVSVIKNILLKAEFIAYTTDCWSSLVQDSYVTLTAHIINENTELQHFTLGTFQICENHTSINLFDYLEGPKGILTEWGLLDINRVYVTDNASNIQKAIVDIGGKNWLGCLGHTINLVVDKGLEVSQVSDVIRRCKSIVKFVKKSNIAHQTLKKHEAFWGISELCVLQECATRWSSCLYMVERIIVLKNPLVGALYECGRTDLILIPNDWVLLRNLSEFF